MPSSEAPAGRDLGANHRIDWPLNNADIPGPGLSGQGAAAQKAMLEADGLVLVTLNTITGLRRAEERHRLGYRA